MAFNSGLSPQEISMLRNHLMISTSPIQEDAELNLVSPISPEFDSLTELPSPIVTDDQTHSRTPSIDSLTGIPSSRVPPSPSKKYGSLTTRPTQVLSNYNNKQRIVSEIDPTLKYLVSPPTRNFSSPLHKDQQLAGLEREQQSISATSLEELTYEGYDNDKISHRWKYVKDIGKGNFSTVVLAELIDSAPNQLLSQVAIKIVLLPTQQETKSRIESSLKRELNILRNMHHPSIIKLLSLNIAPERYLIITPYYKGGDLFELASKHRLRMSPALIRKIFAEIAIGIHYLHFNNIVHRDIKLENILINYSSDELFAIQDLKFTSLITITDFGLSREIDPENPLLKTRCGSEDYVPPELLIGLPYDGRETDSWALGVLLFAVMEGRLPFDPPPVSANTIRSRRQSKVAHRIARIDWSWHNFSDQHKDKMWFEHDWKNAKSLVENLLVRREKRFNTKQICESSYVSEVLNDDYMHFLNR